MPGFAGAEDWSHYGGDAGGTRYVATSQITPANVAGLTEAWRVSTGALTGKSGEVRKRYAFEGTPILAEGQLVLCTPFNEVMALDPESGAVRWRHDPKISLDQKPGNQFICRGVTYWKDEAAKAGAACASRIFMGTNDGRLISLDARDGKPCADFGNDRAHPGEIDAGADRPLVWPGEFQITSPPVVSHGLVVIGSAISDNRRADAPKGTVRAFDARTGAAKWNFDPVARGAKERPDNWMPEVAAHTGHANVWAPISVDEARGLIFLPTTSPSPDFFGGLRKGGAWGVAWFDKRACNAKLDKARSEGIFTPPSTQGTVIYPFTGGGANWGGMAFDPVRKIGVVNVNIAAHIVTLFPARSLPVAARASLHATAMGQARRGRSQ